MLNVGGFEDQIRKVEPHAAGMQADPRLGAEVGEVAQNAVDLRKTALLRGWGEHSSHAGLKAAVAKHQVTVVLSHLLAEAVDLEEHEIENFVVGNVRMTVIADAHRHVSS